VCVFFTHVLLYDDDDDDDDGWGWGGTCADIGPQGIVHGTTLTIVNAALKYLGTTDLRGKVFVSSGLGGMSGAQAKAGVIAGLVAVIAEVDGVCLYI
jgi:urocanate hydratase